MSQERTSVIAAIPYFCPESAADRIPGIVDELLSKTAATGYDHAYILDDASPDRSIEHIVGAHEPYATLVKGVENRGAGGNRNRILDIDTRELGDTILHFLDADVKLEQTSADKARELFASSDILGAVGGLILTENGLQHPYNYGPRLSWLWHLTISIQGGSSMLLPEHRRLASGLRKLSKPLLRSWPDLMSAPRIAEAFYVSEANMLIPFDTFKLVGGYDTNLRDHEAQDLAYKLEAHGLIRKFDPTFIVTHLDVDVRHTNRFLFALNTERKIMQKYGLPWA